MAEQWNADVRDVGDGWWTWCAYLPGRPETAKSGLVRSREEAMALANTTAGIAPKPADPDWMVAVAREAVGLVMDDEGLSSRAKDARDGKEEHLWSRRASVYALRLALERGHVVEPREWTGEDLLQAAREDAAQVSDSRGHPALAVLEREGARDASFEVQAALQARRNMLREMGASAAPAAPAVDLEAALKRAWYCGAVASEMAMTAVRRGDGGVSSGFLRAKAHDIGLILSTLPAKG